MSSARSDHPEEREDSGFFRKTATKVTPECWDCEHARLDVNLDAEGNRYLLKQKT